MQSIFNVKQASQLKIVVTGKNYFKVGIILEVNNEVVVETRMAKRCIANYTNIPLHGFTYSALHPSFKRPFSVGKNLVLQNRVKVYYFVRIQPASIIRSKEESLIYFLQLG